ncbi:hypothetical protein PAXRUDRAFT_835425 [Paxillus rubicundulus Ve08.2h10]|uniref:Long chronological lifespan protein 2 n=1 Tax=Paxillus rubicundulus Ve08.2h10 TaxID=930991 RepID=A0A0D0CLN7_9AGAM|nr:hypothetical protein PAXRUDRAFT_835425 [Paxillus rubicundulus Ve08.2h10]
MRLATSAIVASLAVLAVGASNPWPNYDLHARGQSESCGFKGDTCDPLKSLSCCPHLVCRAENNGMMHGKQQHECKRPYRSDKRLRRRS